MQGFRIADTIRLSDKLLWIGIGVCIFYWVGESALHVLAFREGNLASQILPQNFHEIWKRILVVGLIISFSFYAQLRVNERRENEKVLEESEKKYRTLFEDALNPVFLFDEKGRYIDCNQAALEFLEFSRENLEGKMIWDFCEHHQTLGEVFSNGSAHRNIETDFSPSGKHKTLLLNLVPFSSSDEKTIFVIGQDITERKAMERNIILAHTELNQIFQTASVGMRLIDMDFNVLKMNETFAVLSGANTQDVIGRKCYEGFAGAMCQKPSCPLTRILGGEKEIECEIDKQRLDGSVAHCLLAARPFVGPDGEFVGIVESFKDISELKRFQEELRSERDKLHRILFERFEGVGIVNADFTIEYQNEALKNEMGDCLGKKCYRVFREKQEPCQACMMHEAIKTGKLSLYEFNAHTGRTYEQTYMPFQESDGTQKVVVTLRDVTEAKASKAAAFRSEQLAALGELAAGVAHEINNPINGIINYAQILINKNGRSDVVKDIAGRVLKESDRVARIVESLLSFARREKQSKVLIHVSEILKDTLTLIDSQMRKDSIRLLVNVEPKLPRILAVPQEIQQVLINVLSNARYSLNIKYTQADENKIIEMNTNLVTLDGTRFVRIVCLDHGMGIPEGIIDKVINPFFSTKPKGKGTGLGLSISHEIVNDHGGRMIIESEEKEFTKISIHLPAA